jgi:hypothetical protein
MSYNRSDPTQPSDITDDSPNLNKQFVEPTPNEPKPYERGKFQAKKDLRQCTLCTHQYSPDLDKCPKCGCPDGRRIRAGFPVDITPLKFTAQFRRDFKDRFCWSQKETSQGEVDKHKFVEIRVPVITVIPIMGAGAPTTSYEWHEEVRCKVCSMPYQKISGRGATPEEIQQFKEGKIERASKRMAQEWVE